MTCRVSTTGSQTKFLRSVDLDVVTALLAKKVVLLARKLEDVTSVIAHLQVLLSQPPTTEKQKRKELILLPPFKKYKHNSDKTVVNLIRAMHGDSYAQATPSSRPSEAWQHLSDLPRRFDHAGMVSSKPCFVGCICYAEDPSWHPSFNTKTTLTT